MLQEYNNYWKQYKQYLIEFHQNLNYSYNQVLGNIENTHGIISFRNFASWMKKKLSVFMKAFRNSLFFNPPSHVSIFFFFFFLLVLSFWHLQK